MGDTIFYPSPLVGGYDTNTMCHCRCTCEVLAFLITWLELIKNLIPHSSPRRAVALSDFVVAAPTPSGTVTSGSKIKTQSPYSEIPFLRSKGSNGLW